MLHESLPEDISEALRFWECAVEDRRHWLSTKSGLAPFSEYAAIVDRLVERRVTLEGLILRHLNSDEELSARMEETPRYSYTRRWRGCQLTTHSDESFDDAFAKMRAWIEAVGWTPPRLWQFWRWPEMMVYGRGV